MNAAIPENVHKDETGFQEKPDIKSLTCEELTEQIRDMGFPAYRGNQIFQWLHEKHAVSFSEMTNLPADMRRQLEENCDLRC